MVSPAWSPIALIAVRDGAAIVQAWWIALISVPLVIGLHALTTWLDFRTIRSSQAKEDTDRLRKL
jgi:hypothetical protein